MINFLKKHKILLSILLIPYILLILFVTIPTKYVAYLPGAVDEIEEDVIISSPYQNNGKYYSTSIYYQNKITLFQKLIYDAKKDSYTKKESKIDSKLTNKQESIRGKIEHNNAINSSIIVAYNKANVNIDYEFCGMYVYYTESKILKIGDIILGSSKDECNIIINNYKNQSVDILRDDEIISVNIDEIETLKLEYEYYKINSADIAFEIKKSDSEGPSAGFMQTLSIYDNLVIDSYGNDLKIAGTGTIDINGNVGAIGCVDLKIYTAMYNNCDIFFAPLANKEEALKAISKIDTDMKVVFINTFDEAITYLEGLE